MKMMNTISYEESFNLVGPLLIKRRHKEYGFEVLFISRNVALKTKAHQPQHFGNEHFFNKVGDKHWYVPFYDNFFWEDVSA